MNKVLKTLLAFNSIKNKPRYGWVLCGLKDAENLAQHSFRLAMLVWVLGRRRHPRINVERALKIALVHEVSKANKTEYTFDWSIMPNGKHDCSKVLRQISGVTVAQKQLNEKRDLAKDEAALDKLLSGLKVQLRRDIKNSWLEYKLMSTSEGRFVRQADKVETLLQALEYWGGKGQSPVVGWWEQVDTIVDDPVLLEFIKDVERVFYLGKKPTPELSFLLKLGELKNKSCREFASRGAKKPETIAEHAYAAAMAAWLLGFGRHFNLDKAIKIALVYEVCDIYACKAKVHCQQCVKGGCGGIFHRPRFLKREKERIFARQYKKEMQSLKKLIANLPADLQKELINFWDQCKRQVTFAGTFVNQVFWLTIYLEALRLNKSDKTFSTNRLYDQMQQYIYDPQLIEFLEAIEKEFS